MKKGLIGIIDDDDLDRYIYRKIILLTCPACQIIDFKTGIEALNYLKEHADNCLKIPDICLLDIRMPFLNGWQYLEKYDALKPQLVKYTRHYVCTSSMEQFDLDFKNNNLHGYFMKPVSPGDILKIVKDTEEHYK